MTTPHTIGALSAFAATRRVCILALMMLALFAVACGEDAGSKSAEVAITEVSPRTSYPDVETTIAFEITPGENTSADEIAWQVSFGDGTTKEGEGTTGTVTHAWSESTEYPVTVTALAGGESIGSATEMVTVLAPVDLLVRDSRGTPPNVGTDEQLTVAFRAGNQTADPVLTPFEVSVYLSEEAQVDVEDLETLAFLGSKRIEAPEGSEEVIPAGQAASLSATVDIPDELGSGDYHVVVWIDPAQLADADPSNNLDVGDGIVRVENTSEDAADLDVTDVVALPDRAFPTLNEVTRGFTVVNRGGAEAFDAVARTYLSTGDAQLDDADVLIDETDAFDLGPGGRQTFNPMAIVLDDEISPPTDADLEVWLIVEVSLEGGAVDLDPSNNIEASDPPIVVTDDPVDGADIVVREFTVSPHSTFLDGTLEIGMTVANDGSADAGSFLCGVFLGRQPQVNTELDPQLSSINIAGVASQEEVQVDRSVVFPALYDPGTYYFYVVCDPSGALQEPFRSNNQKIYLTPIEIIDEANVDMYVDNLAVPQVANDGEDIELVASICDAGEHPTGQTRGRLYRSANASPDFDTEPLLEFDVPNVNPNECIDVAIPVTAECMDFEGSYGFGVEVDSNDVLPEQDETNNIRTGSNRLEVAGPYCECVEDGFEPNNRPIEAVPVSAGATSAAVCEANTCDYYSVFLDQGDSLLVTTTFDAEVGALETTLYDPSGLSVLDFSAADDRQEVAEFLVPSDGQYVFSVCAAGAGVRNLYDFQVDVLDQATGIDVLPRGLTVPQRDSFSIGAELDVSFRVYNIGDTASGPFDAGLVLSPNATLGDSDDIPLEPATVQVSGVAASSSTDVNERVRIPTSATDGDYYLGVILDAPGNLVEADVTNNTTLSKLLTIKTACYDPLEPNDGFQDAYALSTGTFSNLTACTTADDYYELCVQDAKKFTLSIDFAHANGDLDVYLYDQQLREIDSSAGDTDTETVSVDYVNGAQCYYARVKLLSSQADVENGYQMSYSVQDVDPTLRCDSYFEPNDGFASAANFLSALQQTQLLDRCPVSDTDYYYVHLSRGQTIDLRGILEPSSQAGTLRVQLYEPNKAPGPNIETAPGVPVAEIQNYTAPADGRYYVQITISGTARRATYRLEADGIGGIDLEATNLVIGPGTYLPNDEVRFGFDLANLRSDTATAPTYEVYLGDQATHDPAADTLLGQFALGDLAGNTTLTVSDRVNLPASLTDGTGYLHVVVAADASQTDPNLSNNVTTTTITLASQ